MKMSADPLKVGEPHTSEISHIVMGQSIVSVLPKKISHVEAGLISWLGAPALKIKGTSRVVPGVRVEVQSFFCEIVHESRSTVCTPFEHLMHIE